VSPGARRHLDARRRHILGSVGSVGDTMDNNNKLNPQNPTKQKPTVL
jgi:hypothetical protein